MKPTGIEPENKLELVSLAKGIVQALDSPLQRMIELSDQLIIQVNTLGPEHQQALAALLLEIERLSFQCADVIHRLSLYSEPVSNLMAVCDLNRIIRDVQVLVSPQFHDPSKIRLSVELEEQLPGLKCDRSLVMVMLANLILNARDAIPDAGNILVKTEYDPLQHAIYLHVSDTGVGTSEDSLGRIFDPFFSNNQAERGDGLRLSVVAGIVRLHRGIIRVESLLRGGTSIHITLPV